MASLAEAVHQEEDEDVQRDQVDDEHVAAPRRHLLEGSILLNFKVSMTTLIQGVSSGRGPGLG